MSLLKLLDSFSLENRTKEEIDTYLSRKEAFKRMSQWGRNAAVAALPLGVLTAMPKMAFGQSTTSVTEILNYALTLEWLEYHFYNHALMGNDVTFTFTAEERAAIELIRDHEQAHVNLLQDAINGLGGTPAELAYTDFDFTAGGAFTTYSSKPVFMILAQAFEDTGVRAYKGQADKLIDNNELLTTALRIHSVEARHAAHIRRMRIMGNYAVAADEKAWITQPDYDGIGEPNVAATAPVYVREQNTTHLDLDVTTVTDVSDLAVQEGWDEPLSKEEVLAIAGNFLAK